MTTECYYADCPFHGVHNGLGEGPYCYEPKCKATEEQRTLYSKLRCLRLELNDIKRRPIPMVLTCPNCRTQHVDAPDHAGAPHRSHLCHCCGTIWRPADVPTVGVASIETCGKADTWRPKR